MWITFEQGTEACCKKRQNTNDLRVCFLENWGRSERNCASRPLSSYLRRVSATQTIDYEALAKQASTMQSQCLCVDRACNTGRCGKLSTRDRAT